MGMSMMALPDASVLEYALTKDMETADRRRTGIEPRHSVERQALRHGPAHGPFEDGGKLHLARTHRGDRRARDASLVAVGPPFGLRDLQGARLRCEERRRRHARRHRDGAECPAARARADGQAKCKKRCTCRRIRSSTRVTPACCAKRRSPKKRALKPKMTSRTGRKRRTTRTRRSTSGQKAKSSRSRSTPPKQKASNAPDVAITVIVAYTKAAASHYSNIETDLIALAIEDANQSFRNSGVGNVRLELAHAYQTDYVEIRQPLRSRLPLRRQGRRLHGRGACPSRPIQSRRRCADRPRPAGLRPRGAGCSAG